MNRQGNADLFGVSHGAGSPAIFSACKALKMNEPGNRIFLVRLIFGQDGQ